MIFYNINTITIGQFGALLKNKNIVNRFNLPLPSKIIEKKATELIAKFNEFNNAQEKNEQSELIDNYHKFSMQNRINNILPSLYSAFVACYELELFGVKEEKLIKDLESLYLDMFGCIPTTDMIMKIPEQINVLRAKYDAIYVEEQKETFDFEVFILKLEDILHPKDIRKEKLSEMKNIINLATYKLKKTNTVTDGRDN